MSHVLSQVEALAVKHPQRIAMEYAGATLTYGELWQAINTLGTELASMAPNAVALDLPDGPGWVIAHLACVREGIAQVPLPPFFTEKQREHALRDAGVNVVVKAPYGAGTDVIPLRIRGYDALLPAGTSIITYTSGSTGTPKGVCLSQKGVERVATSLLSVLGNDVAKRHLSVLPLSVLLEQVGGLYPCLIAGGTYLFTTLPLADALAGTRASSCILVPELLKQLVQAGETVTRSYPHLRFAAVGGARVSPQLLTRAWQLGLPVYEGYGLTESASVAAVNTPADRKAGTVGKPLPHLHLTFAQDGEILLHDPAILGYTGNTDTPPSPYATGDIGTMDAEGYLTILGRKKNILITAGGRNVAPEWLESLLLEQPEVAQAMIYGDGESTLSAFLVPSPSASTEALTGAVARCNTRLPEYARIGTWHAVPPFTAENGMLTGNGRPRRDVILSTYQPKADHGFFRSACA